MMQKEKMGRLLHTMQLAVFVICMVIAAYFVAQKICSDEPLSVFGIEEKPMILIDPGHGGIDGGAENSAGTCEKDINLAISKMLAEKLEAYDVAVKLTREEDRGLYTGVKNDGTDQMEIEGKRSIRSLKSEDLNERKKMAEELDPDIFISIHLNSFKQDRSVFGAQTFYTSGSSEAVGEKSRQLAELIQKELVTQIDNGNDRTAMNKNDVIIMKNAKVPTVIAECGFLSNMNEASQLVKSEYQEKLADAIKKGILEYLNMEEELPEPEDDGEKSGDIIVSD